MQQSLRWENYVSFNSNNINDLWKNHFSNSNKKILYILGDGFDLRMNKGIEQLINSCTGIKLECLLIDYSQDNTHNNTSIEHSRAANLVKLKALIGENINTRAINTYRSIADRSHIGDRNAAHSIISSWSDISNFTDIILDISALPRGIYLSLAGKILSIIDEDASRHEKINYFIITTENAQMDALIQEEGMIKRPKYIHGFTGTNTEVNRRKPMLWLPILGEGKRTYAEESLTELQTDKMEICPVLPFPSNDPRRSDRLLDEHYQLLFEELSVGSKDILYVPEQNPFEAYLGLSNTITRFNWSMSILGGCRAVISPFSSKLLSIGAMLSSYELNRLSDDNKISVSILSTISESYKITDREAFERAFPNSEIFVTWIAGEPYV